MGTVKLASTKARTMHNKVQIIDGDFEVQCKLLDDAQRPIGYIIGGYDQNGEWQNFLVPLKTIDDLQEKTP